MKKLLCFFKKPPFVANFILVFLGMIIPGQIFYTSYTLNLNLWLGFAIISFCFCLYVSYNKQTKWIHWFFSQIVFFLTIYILYLILEHGFDYNILSMFGVDFSGSLFNATPINATFIWSIVNLIVQTIAFEIAKTAKYVFDDVKKSKNNKE